MSPHAPCFLCTTDADLIRRLRAHLGAALAFRTVSRPSALRTELHRGPALFLLDARESGATGLLQEIADKGPCALAIVFGVPRSDPMLQAQRLGAYAVQGLDFNGPDTRALVERALETLRLREETGVLKEKLAALAPSAGPADDSGSSGQPAQPLSECFPPLRHFDNVEALLQGVVDAIADASVVLRAGIFASAHGEDSYRLQAALGCREPVRSLSFDADDPLVRWFELHAQILSRDGLRRIAEIPERLALEHALRAMGAEVAVPLQGRQRLLGWLFLARKATGEPFHPADLRGLMTFAERVAMALDNAALYQEVTLQKTLAEALLHTIPSGIVTAGEDGAVRWVNDAAEKILSVSRQDVLGQPVEVLGSRLGDLFRRSLRGEPAPAEPKEWLDPGTKRHLSVQTARLAGSGTPLGVMACIQDITRERLLNARQRELERASFWTELAANMSHEVRNPLVAIKTFAQLLPERYSDPEFRSEFSSLMAQEVDRLNAVIEQINTFANLPRPVFESLRIEKAVRRGVDLAKQRVYPDGIDLQISVPPDLPAIRGDERALSECVAHIVANAMEALTDRPNPRINITAGRSYTPERPPGVEVTVSDNAGGIAEALRDKVLSPFCTSKKGGMGLGLPIAQRTVSDHEGQLHIATGEMGTTVTISLPTGRVDEETGDEAPADRG